MTPIFKFQKGVSITVLSHHRNEWKLYADTLSLDFVVPPDRVPFCFVMDGRHVELGLPPHLDLGIGSFAYLLECVEKTIHVTEMAPLFLLFTRYRPDMKDTWRELRSYLTTRSRSQT